MRAFSPQAHGSSADTYFRFSFVSAAKKRSRRRRHLLRRRRGVWLWQRAALASLEAARETDGPAGSYTVAQRLSFAGERCAVCAVTDARETMQNTGRGDMSTSSWGTVRAGATGVASRTRRGSPCVSRGQQPVKPRRHR